MRRTSVLNVRPQLVQRYSYTGIVPDPVRRSRSRLRTGDGRHLAVAGGAEDEPAALRRHGRLIAADGAGRRVGCRRCAAAVKAALSRRGSSVVAAPAALEVPPSARTA